MFTIPNCLPTETSDWNQLTPLPVLCIINSVRFLVVRIAGTVPLEHTQPNWPQLFLMCVSVFFFIPLLPLVSVLPPANPPLLYAVVAAAQNRTRHYTLLLPWCCWRLNSGPRNCRGAHLLPEPSLKLRNSWNYTVCKREAHMEGKFSRDLRMECTK